jgi:DNA (cytosine-5)-methyltransferase 1
LAGMGYRTTWGIFSASECGAPHRRKRVFILAYADGERGQGSECFLRDACEIGQGRTDSAADSDIDDAWLWPSGPNEPQRWWEPPRVVGNSEDRSNRQHSTEQQGRSAFSRPSGEESVADSHRIDRSAQAEGREHDRQVGPAGEELGDAGCKRQEERQLPSDWSEQSDSRQTQPPLGGDTDEPASGLDYAELCVTCDNRTDELRLLGNGVVPATAALAFRTLAREIIASKPIQS